MKRIPVVKRDQLPVRSPLSQTLVMWLLLDRLAPPGWVVGAVATIYTLAWVGFLVRFWHEDETPLRDLEVL